MKINKKYMQKLRRNASLEGYDFTSPAQRKEFYSANREYFLSYKKMDKEEIYNKILGGVAITIGIAVIGAFGYLIYEGPVKDIASQIKEENIAKQVPEIQKLDSIYSAKRDSLIQDYQNKHPPKKELK